MFQYAALLGISRIVGSEAKIQQPPKGELIPWESIEIGFFRIGSSWLTHEDIKCIQYRYEEPYFHFNPEAFSIPNWSDIRGYFQSEKYFSHIKDEVLEKFVFHKDTIKASIKRRNTLLDENENLVALHVRRGDYPDLKDYHYNLTTEYYRRAIEYLTKKLESPKFVVLSDDLQWCRENLSDLPVIIENNSHTAQDDMCLMSQSDGHIIANSSFSWWGSYLADKDKSTTVAPKRWFGPLGPQDYYDVYRDGWMIIGE